MKPLLFAISMVLVTPFATAQVPYAFNYQGLARDANGDPLAEKEISLLVSIISGFAEGNIEFQEEHVVMTDEYGLFAIRVGEGTYLLGNPRNLDWGNNSFFLRTEMDPEGGENYIDMGTSQLFSVPYALFAAEAGNASGGSSGSDDQTLSLVGTTLSIENGNSVNLAVLQDGTEDADADPRNEIQELIISGSQLSISNGNTVAIPGSADDQTLSFSGNTLSISGGNSVNLSALINDADADPQNELQTLSFSNNQLSISGGNSVTLSGGGSNLWQDEGSGIYFEGAFADLRNEDGTNAVELRRSSNGSGRLDIYGANNTVRTTLSTTADDAGSYRSEGPNGNLNVLLSAVASDENKGWVAAYNEKGETRAALFASATGRGGVYTNGENGNGNVTLSALGSNVNHGYVAVRDAGGDIEAGMYVDASGNGRVFADFVDTFVDNPDKAGTKVRYSIVQGPEPAAFLRGTAVMKNGQASVEFPSHFKALVEEGTMTVMLTPLSAESRGMAVIKKSRDGFVIRELMNGRGNYDFDWEVKARRQDVDGPEEVPQSERGIHKAANDKNEK